MEKEKFENQKLIEEQAVFDSIQKKKNELFGNKGLDEIKEMNTKIINYSKLLERNYPDFKQYYLLHALIGGSREDLKYCDKFDFPGEDSVVKFMDDLYREYKQEESS
ncbi:MAG: hypothetical protein Q8O93_04255 [bacterium]|nr:hypothetical protein [bacterium]